MNDKNEAEPSIVDIVQMRGWKHALLTTYTLSLSYFESEILQSLLRGGCSDIWLVADAEPRQRGAVGCRGLRIQIRHFFVRASHLCR
jgi:hypothetical protein